MHYEAAMDPVARFGGRRDWSELGLELEPPLLPASRSLLLRDFLLRVDLLRDGG
jgi:hypothetical protein